MHATPITFGSGSSFTINDSFGPTVSMAGVGGLNLELDALAGLSTITGSNQTNDNSTVPLILHIATGAVLALAQPVGTAPDAVNLQVADATIDTAGSAPTGTLDLGNSGMFINYGAAANDPAMVQKISGYLASGFNANNWDDGGGAFGITTSLSLAHAGQINGIGYADYSDGRGVDTVPNSIELRYTVEGDLNLTGTVEFADFAVVVADYGTSQSWDGGTVLYDGTVSFNDFAIVVADYGKTV
jgi:hypothetical protein